MPMDLEERERFGGLSARADALKERIDKLEDRRFTTGQTWLMVGAVIAAGIIGSVGSLIVVAISG